MSASFLHNPDQQSTMQADIWHGVRSWGDSPLMYERFVSKLQTYHADPDNFVGDRIRYDDLTVLDEVVQHELVPNYLNQKIWAADLGARRYTPLLVSTLQ
jgi:hypothetical protein